MAATYLHLDHPAFILANPLRFGDLLEVPLWPDVEPGDVVACGTCGYVFTQWEMGSGMVRLAPKVVRKKAATEPAHTQPTGYALTVRLRRDYASVEDPGVAITTPSTSTVASSSKSIQEAARALAEVEENSENRYVVSSVPGGFVVRGYLDNTMQTSYTSGLTFGSTAANTTSYTMVSPTTVANTNYVFSSMSSGIDALTQSIGTVLLSTAAFRNRRAR